MRGRISLGTNSGGKKGAPQYRNDGQRERVRKKIVTGVEEATLKMFKPGFLIDSLGRTTTEELQIRRRVFESPSARALNRLGIKNQKIQQQVFEEYLKMVGNKGGRVAAFDLMKGSFNGTPNNNPALQIQRRQMLEDLVIYQEQFIAQACKLAQCKRSIVEQYLQALGRERKKLRQFRTDEPLPPNVPPV